MVIILNLFFLYVKNALSDRSKILFNSLLIIASAYNGFLLTSLTSSLNINRTVNFVYIFLFFATIIIKFFPSLSAYQKPVKRKYPISKLSRYAINLINDSVLSLNFLAITSFLSFFFFFSPKISNDGVILLILSVICAYIIRRVISTLIFQKLPIRNLYKLILSTFLLFLLAYFYIAQYARFSNSYTIPFIIIVFNLFWYGFFVEEILTKYNSHKVKAYVVFRNPYRELVFFNKKSRFNLLMAIILKIIMLLTVSVAYIQRDKYPSFMIIMLFTSPIFMFNYLINNFFGFYDKYWLAQEKAKLKGKYMFVNYLKLIKYPLVIDFVITLLFALFNTSLLFNVITIYFGAIILLIPLGFYWSVLYPKKIEENLFSTKPTSGIIPVFMTLAICSLLTLILINKWYILIIVLYALISFFCIKKLNVFYLKNHQKIYSKLNNKLT